MKIVLILCAFSVLIACQSPAARQSTNQSVPAPSKTRQANDLDIHGGLPSRPERPEPARIKRRTANTPTALCNDDNYSFSRNVNFTCSGHGGVKEWTFDKEIEIKPDDPRYFED